MAFRRRSKVPANLTVEESGSGKKAFHFKWRLSCVRCREICNPNYYMVCKAKGHFLCAKCAWLEEPRPSHYLCCNPENLRKGQPRNLEVLLDQSKWACLYKPNGCGETPKGLDWQQHVDECIFKCDYHCFYRNCKGVTHGIDETINHYKENHMLTELRMKNSILKLNLIYDRSEDGVKRRLMLLKDDNEDAKDYIVGTEVTEKDFNVFIWDCSQRENYKKGESGRRYELVVLPFPGDKFNAVGQLKYAGMCQPMEKTPEEIIENADCFSISVSRLMKKYLGTYPGCPELDVCNVLVNLATKQAPKPEPQLPVHVGNVRNGQRGYYMDPVSSSCPSWM